MPYNLIDEPWIPVRCVSGERRWIAPWQVSDRKDPPIRIDTGRPDFDGALIQFLIGLMQTAAAPADNRSWRKMFDQPPGPDELRERFSSVRDAFVLDGDGPRFMQDLTLTEKEAEESPVSALLIDSPGEFDHFVKRDRVAKLSHAAVAAALLTLQLNGPAGGRGHRTGIRGGGPLTTLLGADNLFELIAFNVLSRSYLEDHVPGRHDEGLSPFPWMKPTVTSERDRGVTPEELSALTHYWAMPRRIRVRFESIEGRCDLYAERPAAARTTVAKSYGTMYKGAFVHPLTPYAIQKDGSHLSRKGRPNAFQYRDWAKVALGTEDSRPAAVIAHFFAQHARGNRRVEMFGYDMDNAKPIAFRWSSTLLLGETLDTDQRQTLAVEASARVSAATHVLRALLSQLRRAWEGEHPGDRGDMEQFEEQFWSSTEHDFFASVGAAMELLASPQGLDALRERWLETLHRAVLAIFDEHSGLRGATTDVTLRNVALARRDLVRFTHPNGKALRRECGLAAPAAPARSRRKGSKNG